MNKEKIILALLVSVFLILLVNNLMTRNTDRVKELTYKTGERKDDQRVNPIEFPILRKDLFPVKRKSFKIGKKNIFSPLRYVRRAPAPVVTRPEVKLPLSFSPNPLYIYVGSNENLEVINASGDLSAVINPPGIALARGTFSPLGISCLSVGTATIVIKDGSSSANVTLTCDLRPEEKKLATYTFLGFLEKEKDKTIFLSRKPDKEILIVKKGDVLIKKNTSILQDYVVKKITDDKIMITSSDGSDTFNISLIENEPLKKNRKE
ncbi:MAG: hypothetical protein OEV42_06125 [Deltaproteobacteria bacterium]|nr:hypothetical protein [Deltaproteobacteria bacterium]